METCLIVEAASGETLEEVGAGIVEHLETHVTHSPWHAFVLRTAVCSQVTVMV